MGRLWDSVSALPLQVESYALEGLRRTVSGGFDRHSTIVVLRGSGAEGRGEDVTYSAGDQLALQRAGTPHSLGGRFTLGEFSQVLDAVELFPRPPEIQSSRAYRRWAFESAALDLALRQAGRSAAELFGRSVAGLEPLEFVVSLRLGNPPTIAPIRSLLELAPDTRFKLDATSQWDEQLIGTLAETGAVDSVDFKGAYKGTIVDQAADPELYERVARGLPGVWLEDPELTVETSAVLAGHEDRVTWDAPIHSVADIEGLPFAPRMLNIKPSRFGTWEALLAAYDYCKAREIANYGGGQFELGIGREQIQYLASLFHARAPNDVAPVEYNAEEPGPGLPTSPLALVPEPVGFRLAPSPGSPGHASETHAP